MATIEIQLKAFAKIVGTDRNCQVDLKRSVFEIDRDINEIKIPLQALVKLRKIVPSSPQAVSSSILPAPQAAQMSLPIIPKIHPRDELHHQPRYEDPNLQTMVSTFNIPINVGNERKLVKTTLRYKKAPKAQLNEIETQTDDEPVLHQIPLSDLYPKDPVARALMLHQDRLQPVKQALREIKTKISNLKLEQKMAHRYTLNEGKEYFVGTENSPCPFIKYLMNQEQDGQIDTNMPISKFVGEDYLLMFQHEKDVPRASMAIPSVQGSALDEEKRDSKASGSSGGEKSKSGGSTLTGGEAGVENADTVKI